jgi:hypothetical protein
MPRSSGIANLDLGIFTKSSGKRFFTMPSTRQLVYNNMSSAGKYTCTEYREEMVLLGLKRRLADPALPEKEKRLLKEHIGRLEQEMGMD